MQVISPSKTLLISTGLTCLLVLAPQALAQETAPTGAATEQQEPEDVSPSFVEQALALIGVGVEEPVDGEEPAEEVVDETTAPVLRAVELATPADRQTILQRNFFGRVVARETADLAFPLNGTLVALPIEEGTVVEPGQLLAQLDLAPFERAVERAELQLVQAERNLERAQELARQNVGTRTQADDAETVRDLADVALREARDALEDATITAPYRGLVAERLTANHVIVAPGTPVVRIHDVSQMRVDIDVPERLLQRFPRVDQVTFTAHPLGSDTPIELSIVEFQAQTERVGQSYQFSLALPDVSSMALLPGSSLTVTAALPHQTLSLILPTTAIAADENRDPYVMVFEPAGAEEGVVRAVEVDVTSMDGTSFEVTGLSSDVEVVNVGAHLLRDGQTVRRYTGLKVEE
ncbi:MAG: efflux RND transporter periplasmic adaptor subunit [Pseudomonadota bacterium]